MPEMSDVLNKPEIKLMEGTYAVVRLASDSDVDLASLPGGFLSVTRTEDELSVVCETDVLNRLSEAAKVEPDWCCFKVLGPLDFGLTGVLSGVLAPLAKTGVSVFAVSTFETDYVLVKVANREKAVLTLREAGYVVHDSH